MQLIELDIPMVIALNMMDEVIKNKGSIDVNGLEATLGVPVIPITAAKNEGVDELIEHAINVAKFEEHPERLDFCANDDGKEGAVHRCIHSIIHIIEDHTKAINLPTRFAATKIVENDAMILRTLDMQENDVDALNHIIEQMEAETKLDRYAALTDMRFSFIERLCNDYVFKPRESIGHKFSTNLDKILTGKYSAILGFLGIMAFVFYLTFGPFGTFFSDIMNMGIDWITNFIDVGEYQPFITGFMAKESVVSTLTVLLGDVSKLLLVFTKLTAFVFLVFSLLYTHCVAAIATVKRELGKTYAICVVILQCSIAWVVAYCFYKIGSLIY